MENAVTNCPFPPGLGEEDRAVFQRVWRRVMPEERADCPIAVTPAEVTLLGAGDVPCTCICPQPAPRPQPRREECSPHLGCDFPDGEDIPCLGPSSAVYGAQLQRQTVDALDCWQVYRQLARRAGGGICARTLTTLAAEKMKSARRLAAAYFLISGVRWWPADQLAPRPLPSFHGMLRRGFLSEQQRAQAYDDAAGDTGDSALAQLYRELARQSREHSNTLRTILEQSGFGTGN